MFPLAAIPFPAIVDTGGGAWGMTGIELGFAISVGMASGLLVIIIVAVAAAGMAGMVAAGTGAGRGSPEENGDPLMNA
ncbi:hypothetical protein HK101_010418 [Irineochytrium annulatum]|nr:hypothetical protein HK101_010418 [Irineochytrium annulatum]